MSSNVHLSTLTYLREYFQTNSLLRAFRLSGMLALLVMLYIALLATISFSWTSIMMLQTGCGIPGSCALLEKFVQDFWPVSSYTPHNISPQVILSYFLLTGTYGRKVLMLFKTTRCGCTCFLQLFPLRYLERLVQRSSDNHDTALSKLRGKSLAIQLCYRTFIGFYYFYLAISDLIGSFAMSLLILAVGLAWGSLQLFVPRSRLPACVEEVLNDWGYGQVLPLLLLALPLLGVANHYLGEHSTLIWIVLALNNAIITAPEDCHHQVVTGSTTESETTGVPATSSHNFQPDHSSLSSTSLMSSLFGLCAQGNEEEAEASRQFLHKKIYCTTKFKLISVLLWLIALGIAVAFFVQTDRAFHQPTATHLSSWVKFGWNLPPVAVACLATLIFVLLFSVLTTLCGNFAF